MDMNSEKINSNNNQKENDLDTEQQSCNMQNCRTKSKCTLLAIGAAAVLIGATFFFTKSFCHKEYAQQNVLMLL